MRILDCKSPICKEVAKNAPKTVEHLCAACSEHMDSLCDNLKSLEIPFEIDPNIVRGLDYYTRTVFEFITPVIGAQSTVCGGGRYDGLVKEIGGPNLSGIGFAMGITRLILALEATNKLPCVDYQTDLYIASMGKEAAKTALVIANAVRNAALR
jgi:histidyl-tRNA synthetase